MKIYALAQSIVSIIDRYYQFSPLIVIHFGKKTRKNGVYLAKKRGPPAMTAAGAGKNASCP
jgi:hypothetical protein